MLITYALGQLVGFSICPTHAETNVCDLIVVLGPHGVAPRIERTHNCQASCRWEVTLLARPFQPSHRFYVVGADTEPAFVVNTNVILRG